nr:type II toxin-antitoxin system VapC family toxin [Stakelama sediminis]
MLDTNICIYILADAESPATRRLEECVPGTAVISSIACAELYRGLRKDDEAAMLEAFFAIVPVLDFGRAEALAYRRIPFQRGRFDRLIAAHALALGLTLVTNNERDFDDVPRLKVENWTQ